MFETIKLAVVYFFAIITGLVIAVIISDYTGISPFYILGGLFFSSVAYAEFKGRREKRKENKGTQ